MSVKNETRRMIRERRARRKAAVSKPVAKMAVTAASVAAVFLLSSAGQALGATCTAGSVDGSAPGTPMCFGTMFPNLSAFHYSDQEAADLAATMNNPRPDPPGVDRGTADDSATLPSEYTYLGQFIDHNLDFDRTA